MSEQEPIPRYSRQQLRKSSRFVEGDYSDINPREFYRNVKRSLEEIQDGEGFKYQTRGDQNSDLEISSESVGEKTGTVEGRLVAESDWSEAGTGVLEHRPYGPHGALAIVVGLLLAFFGMGSPEILVFGVALTVGGAYYYFQTKTDQFPICQQDYIQIFITGEVSERTIDGSKTTRTEMVANMSVVYAGNTYVAVETNRLDELDWTFRRELTNQVKRWYNGVMDDDRKTKSIEEGFVAQLKSWSNNSLESDRRTIEQLQDELLGLDFDTRESYTEVLQKQLPERTISELEQHQKSLLDELEDLAEEVNIYVEREGLEHTNRMERDATKNPELESGRR